MDFIFECSEKYLSMRRERVGISIKDIEPINISRLYIFDINSSLIYFDLPSRK